VIVDARIVLFPAHSLEQFDQKIGGKFENLKIAKIAPKFIIHQKKNCIAISGTLQQHKKSGNSLKSEIYLNFFHWKERNCYIFFS
jgi:hypothetical protein